MEIEKKVFHNRKFYHGLFGWFLEIVDFYYTMTQKTTGQRKTSPNFFVVLNLFKNFFGRYFLAIELPKTVVMSSKQTFPKLQLKNCLLWSFCNEIKEEIFKKYFMSKLLHLL